MTKLLAVRPSPLENENFHSYVRKLAEANACPIAWVTELFGLRVFTFHAPDDKVLRAVADATLQPVESIRNLTMHRFARRLNLNKDKNHIHNSMVRRFHHKDEDGLRFCPQCLKEGKPWSVPWYLGPVTVCLEHKSLLFDTCPVCHRPVSYERLGLGVCSCGADLTALGPIPAGPEGLAAQRIIQSRLTERAANETVPRSANWFAGLSFFHRVFDQFPPGSLTVDGLTVKELTGVRGRSRPVEVDHVYYTLAVQALAHGDKAFAEVDKLWLASLNRAHVPEPFPLETLSVVIDMILHSYLRSPTEELRASYRAFNREKGEALRGKQLLRLPPEVTGPRAAGILECSTSGIKLLIKRGLLAGYVGPINGAGRAKVFVETGSLLRALRRRMHAISLAKAADMAGIPYRKLYEYYAAGILPAEYGPHTDGHSAVGVPPSIVPVLIQERPLILAQQQPAGWLDELRAQLHAAAGRGDAGDPVLFEALEPGPTASRDGQESDGGGSSGLSLGQAASRLGVTVGVVKTLGQEKLLSIQKGIVFGVDRFLDDYYWDIEAAIEVRQSLSSLDRWVRQGRITPVLSIGQRALFRKADLIKISRAYSVPKAAEVLGCPPQKIRGLIARGELEPVSGPGVDGAKEFLLLESDVFALKRKGVWGERPQKARKPLRS